LAAVHRAAASGADVALITRGGYGLTRILPAIQYKKVAKAIEHGTQFVGLSDFTAFQSALLAKTGAITWAGPALGEDFGAETGVDDIMDACFDDLIQGHGEGAGWRLPAVKKTTTVAATVNAPDVTTAATLAALVPAVSCKGQLWGGNLAVLMSLVGTPYFPVVRGGILFIEDVAEYPWRIERMLTQLLHTGVLAKQKALVFGQFTGYKATPHDKGFKLQTVVDWLQARVKIPVLQGLPFGHVPTKVLLPVGATVNLAVEGREAFLVWGHLD
jgi:muramoyltetrapeptide carboxypeptidase